jgi:hypothetical protein
MSPNWRRAASERTQWPLGVRAQQTERMRRIGVLMGTIETDVTRRAEHAVERLDILLKCLRILP